MSHESLDLRTALFQDVPGIASVNIQWIDLVLIMMMADYRQ